MRLAHIVDDVSSSAPWWVLAIAVAVAALVIEHHLVAAFDRAVLARRLRIGIASAVAVTLAASALPIGSAQSSEAQLPDLISDPPRPSYFNELNTPDGGTRLVVTFDGYVHNIGEGALDVVGNPQEPNGMVQRVRDGDGWQEVGNPTVRFETDDGHNHFHLIEAVDYVLWDEAQGAQTALGSKIGFCLVDSEQMEPGFEQSYSEELDNFCEENNPDATDLRMGISPGWRDVYDATTTLQWVDVSETPPGRYWIGAITDPNDEILESNEDNNDLIFSDSTISVPGFAPLDAAPVTVDEPMAELTLATSVHGTVTTPVYTIEEGPQHGSLDVPLGADLADPTVRYSPEPGFTGTDRIVFSVRDAASPYPLTAPTASIELDVVAASNAEDPAALPTEDPAAAPLLIQADSTFFDAVVGERFTTTITAIGPTGEASDARLFATGLPSGLVLDPASGIVTGIPRETGIHQVTVTALGDGGLGATLDATWVVEAGSNDAVGLGDVGDQSSPYRELTRLRVGTNRLGMVLETEGLPPGLELAPGAPVIQGTPTEVGVYDVIVREVDGSRTVAEVQFTWTIRPTAVIDFVF